MQDEVTGMSLDTKRKRILKMHAFSLNISYESVMDTGKCNVFLKARILVASTENQNVKLNRKLAFLYNSKETD